MSFYGVVMMGGVGGSHWGAHNELDIAVQSQSFKAFSGENKQGCLMKLTRDPFDITHTHTHQAAAFTVASGIFITVTHSYPLL